MLLASVEEPAPLLVVPRERKPHALAVVQLARVVETLPRAFWVIQFEILSQSAHLPELVTDLAQSQGVVALGLVDPDQAPSGEDLAKAIALVSTNSTPR